ncbi:MAG: hypothetical protein MAG715_00097 [Methanonatronarchaeales archaeon]|nr:hypothetical protein [Methanonatronarchaeales archaeon]
MTRVLPDELRDELRRPIGRLVSGDSPERVAEEAWPENGHVIAVGDIVTYHLLEAGHIPDVSIIDDRSMRENTGEAVRREVRRGFRRSVKAKNPPGHLTDELVEAVEAAVEEGDGFQVVVDGEEDLAVIPAVRFAEVGSTVLYGQPSEGVVVVEVTGKRKREIKRLVDRMEVLDGN